MVTRRERQTPTAAAEDVETLRRLKAGLLADFDDPATAARDRPAIAREIRIIDGILGSRPSGSGDRWDELAEKRKQRRGTA